MVSAGVAGARARAGVHARRARLAGSGLRLGAGRRDGCPGAGGAHPDLAGGAEAAVARPLVEAIRTLLCSDERVPFLHPSAHELLDGWREQWREVLSVGRTVLQRQDEHLMLYTFAGDASTFWSGSCSSRDESDALHRQLLDQDAVAGTRRIRSVRCWNLLSTLEETLPLENLVEASARGRLSKFQRFLPPALETVFAASRLFDVAGAREVCSSSHMATAATAPTA